MVRHPNVSPRIGTLPAPTVLSPQVSTQLRPPQGRGQACSMSPPRPAARGSRGPGRRKGTQVSPAGSSFLLSQFGLAWTRVVLLFTQQAPTVSMLVYKPWKAGALVGAVGGKASPSGSAWPGAGVGQRWAVTRSRDLGYDCHISSVAPAEATEGTS